MKENSFFSIAKTIFVVSGLPRSGTSMMMQILQAGGVEILTDNLRQTDEHNPQGYLEFERVKKLRDGDYAWLDQAKGKAVKIISALLENLPSEYQYKIIFMSREMDEILASQNDMLIKSGKPNGGASNTRMGSIYEKHLYQVDQWLSHQNNIEVIKINYNQTIANPWPTCEKLADFLGVPLNISKMVQAVNQELYRHRKNINSP